MKVLQRANGFISQMITQNESDSYKASQFNVIKKIENHHILFNTLTRELVELTEEEYKYYISKNYSKDENNAIFNLLKNKNFLVESTVDELKRYKEMLVLYRIVCNNTNTGIAQYKIFTTTYCNARCFYCFEEGMPQNHMTIETAENVVQYILKTHQKGSICLYWFGGEPLCNVQVIDYICKRMNDENIPFTSKIITNGYLFNEQLVQKAVDLWKLEFAQITLDGTEEEHNKRKAYIKTSESPFVKTLNNIELLLKKNVRVVSRLNYDEKNLEDIEKLIDLLYEKFNSYNNYRAYPAVLSADWLNHSSSRSAETTEFLHDKFIEYSKKLQKYNFSKPYGLSTQLKPYFCMAANPALATISSNGELYTCQSTDDNMKYGNVIDGILKPEIPYQWESCVSTKKKCDTCAFLPECSAFDKCPDDKTYCQLDKDFLLQRQFENILFDKKDDEEFYFDEELL